MKNNTYFPMYIHLIILFVAAFIFAYVLDVTMQDDGLRHISFSANIDIMKSWGDVFPHSLFTQYDQWLVWHKLLELLLIFIPYDSVHIFINTFSLFALMFLLYKYINEEIKYDFSSLTYIIVFSITLITSYRYLTVRPDLLSGLFVFFAILHRNKFLPIFLLTILYAPFYYLFFLYTGSMGLVYMVQKKWRSFFGLFLGSLLIGIGFLLHDFEGYVNTVKYILTDQSLRMGLEVGEGQPLFSILSHLNYFILLPIFLLVSIGFIYYKYSYFKENTLATFLLITSILWMNQTRFFQIFLPLIVVYMFCVFVNSNKKAIARFIRRYYIIGKKYFSYSKNVPIFYIIIIPYCIGAFAYAFYTTNPYNKVLATGELFKDKKFDNKRILLNRMNIDIYKGLYFNPSTKFIPSCSVGWFEDKDPAMKDIYIRMQEKEGISEIELSKLIKYVDADIYIHYLVNEKQVLNFSKLTQLGIIAEFIYENRIIFKINKDKRVNHE